MTHLAGGGDVSQRPWAFVQHCCRVPQLLPPPPPLLGGGSAGIFTVVAVGSQPRSPGPTGAVSVPFDHPHAELAEHPRRVSDTPLV
jgi:hypothetical protein